jgi:hypothetical protein
MQLRHVLVLTRDVGASVLFWGPRGMGLSLLSHTDTFAELSFAQASPTPIPVLPPTTTTLALQLSTNEATLSTGYNVQLVVDVPGGLDEMLHRVLGLGAHMDGPVK